jgi:hypothetical protein
MCSSPTSTSASMPRTRLRASERNLKADHRHDPGAGPGRHARMEAPTFSTSTTWTSSVSRQIRRAVGAGPAAVHPEDVNESRGEWQRIRVSEARARPKRDFAALTAAIDGSCSARTRCATKKETSSSGTG